MAERDDTEPTESIKASPSLCENKIDTQICCLSTNEKRQEVDLLMKDLASCKLQLEMEEDSTYTPAVVKFDVYQRTVKEMSAQVNFLEADTEIYREECKKSQVFVSMPESEYEAVTDKLVDYNKVHEQLSQTVDELKNAKEELLQLKNDLAAAEESKTDALMKAETAEKKLRVEKEKNNELLTRVSELNEAILSSDLAAIEADKVRLAFFARMEAELQTATDAVIQSHEQVEQLKMQLAMKKDFRNELLEKTILSDYYLSELMQAKELLVASIGLMQTVISNERKYSVSIEARTKQLENELKSTKEEVSNLNDQIDKLTDEIQNMKGQLFESNERELEQQVEIAMLKAEIHKSRSRIAAAEAAEARALSAQSGFYLAVQQLALEAETAKKAAETLKLEMGSGITISVGEYESLIHKTRLLEERAAILVPPSDEPKFLESAKNMEIDIMKEELDAAKAEVGDLKFALEEAMRRAEMAENAKSAIEGQLRKWREKQKLRREQSAGKSVEHDRHSSYNKHRTTSLQDGKNFNYVPLGKVLNMKF